MRKFIGIALALLLLLGIGLWSYLSFFKYKKIEAPVVKADSVHIKLPGSVFRLPIRYSLKELESFINIKTRASF